MKLVSLNIEGDRHFDRVLPFVEKESPDVLCLQEVFEPDLFRFKDLGYYTSFSGETLKMQNGIEVPFGYGICSREQILNEKSFYYRNGEYELRFFDQSRRLQSTMESKRGIILVDTTIDNVTYSIGTVHFTWTPNGDIANPEQISSMASLLEYTQTLPPHILTGDFNIPRSKNILYKELIEHYTDTVPASYASSLDKSLHYAGENPELNHLFTDYLVDYIFTQPPYTARDVRLEFGISDHAGVVATILKE